MIILLSLTAMNVVHISSDLQTDVLTMFLGYLHNFQCQIETMSRFCIIFFITHFCIFDYV